MIILIFIVAIIIGIILLIVWLVRRVNHSDEDSLKTSNALKTLKEKYAEGEITKEEFEKINKVLVNG